MVVKALILGAGYGTRLQKDLINNETYHHLLGVPKALLPLGGRDCLITHWLDKLTESGFSKQEDIYVVTNEASANEFAKWAERHDIPLDHIINDGTTTNDTRLGAVPDILFGIDHIFKNKNNSSVLVIGGDTLFLKDFDLDKFMGQKQQGACLVTTYTVDDNTVPKVGIVETNEQGVIRSFLEKPSAHETTARQACPCFYLLDPLAITLIRDFLADCKQKQLGLDHYDATGKALAYLYPRLPVHTFPISGRIDVGGLQSYIDAHHYFSTTTLTTGNLDK
ncbi:nucleotide-diphospho-sugar transferase [Halteromyces radiatus]|uniref:nucleotide-diphospho-sugar transferase n=1 Tax=Halteromyces radiatus TaxID=101107 RepID=UPI00221FEB2F|nr:nucleotide-diphospho-sugar transferase [Halteromyces radiatus]KAI8098896.1 nucleotide-diphospho-sugar transferase [Halteromyces radiatus]